ncbi:MAG: phospholipase D-like domain-containing protein [Actinomycetota bacterium]|nr:phospholipase D-like domain-containing protein [Actinomycetota bacterium]
MRFSSRRAKAGQIFAVTGVNTISFALVVSPETADGLLGFAVERVDPAGDERFFVPGFKVFRSVIPEPDASTQVSTFDHPVQSFAWDDFTAKPDRRYQFLFHPVKGRPKNLDRRPPLKITVRTEPLVSDLEHDVFFNRGVASSQAYRRRFGTTPVDKLTPREKRDGAIQWLSRDLDEAILRFVDSCAPGDRLLGCFYEFRWEPVARALKAAIDRGVDVRVIVDAKANQGDFPRKENLETVDRFRIPRDNLVLREARDDHIQHNKFMVRVEGGQRPVEVWTGSTNMSLGGISGQTNVGHWVRNPGVAGRFARYWDLLATDPGGRPGDPPPDVRKKNKAFRDAVEELSPVGEVADVPPGVTALFSPRRDTALLQSYARLLDSAHAVGCITLAFGVSPVFKDLLKDNTPLNALVFMLLEKKDKPDPKSQTAFVAVNASNNVYKAWGSFIKDPVYQWAAETNARALGLNKHVSYVHSKFLLVDPLGADPIVVTGSANFSNASTRENDENMLVVRGDRRVADIYFTEFNRLFNHYYFRSVTEDRSRPGQRGRPSLFLAETDEWQQKYAPGTFRAKRLAAYAAMQGFSRG